jgi:hypothetical protein
MDSVHVAQTNKVNHGLARVDGRMGSKCICVCLSPLHDLLIHINEQ